MKVATGSTFRVYACLAVCLGVLAAIVPSQGLEQAPVFKIVGGKPVPAKCDGKAKANSELVAKGYKDDCPGACKRSPTVVALAAGGGYPGDGGGGGGDGGDGGDGGLGDWGSKCKGAWVTEFPCMDNEQCIPLAQDCDGTKQCKDGSDEMGCAGSSTDPNMRRSLLSTMKVSRRRMAEKGSGGKFTDILPGTPNQCLDDDQKAQRAVAVRQSAASYSQFCGGEHMGLFPGTNSQYIVTAAHCIWDDVNKKGGVWTKVSGKSAILGERDLQTSEGTEEIIEWDMVIAHPDYDHDNVKNDVAVIKLKEKPKKNKASSVYDIAAPPPPGTLAMVTGWGTLSSGGSQPNVLQYVQVPIQSGEACKESYGDGVNMDQEVCAGLPEGGKDSCQGDSGGPLYYQGKDPANPGKCKSFYVGTVSWGRDCASASFFGVYAKASTYKDWFIKQLGGSGAPAPAPVPVPVPGPEPAPETMPPTAVPDTPDTMPPTAVPETPETMPPTAVPEAPETMPPTAAPETMPPTAVPIATESPTASPGTKPPTEPVDCNDYKPPEIPMHQEDCNKDEDGNVLPKDKWTMDIDCNHVCFKSSQFSDDKTLPGPGNGICEDGLDEVCWEADDTSIDMDIEVFCTEEYNYCLELIEEGSAPPVPEDDAPVSDDITYVEFSVEEAKDIMMQMCADELAMCLGEMHGGHDESDESDDTPGPAPLPGYDTPTFITFPPTTVKGMSRSAMDHAPIMDDDDEPTMDVPIDLYCEAHDWDGGDCAKPDEKKKETCASMYECETKDGKKGVYDCMWITCLTQDKVDALMKDGECQNDMPDLNCARFVYDNEVCLSDKIKEEKADLIKQAQNSRSLTIPAPTPAPVPVRPPTDAAPSPTAAPAPAPAADSPTAPAPTSAPAAAKVDETDGSKANTLQMFSSAGLALLLLCAAVM